MNQDLLARALVEIKAALHLAITSASYGGKAHDNGLAAKTALIRSETLIQRVHEVTKQGIHDELEKRKIKHKISPAIGQNSPELNVWGLLKKKKQDVLVTIGDVQRKAETIQEGPLTGQIDQLGSEYTQDSIVVGVRSQLSSVNKNFDTLMERTFAEPLNLRLRHPRVVMGEVYMLAVKSYDEQLMKDNAVGWNEGYTNVERFIEIFNAINSRTDYEDIKSFYKYERCLLLLVDFSVDPPKIYKTIKNLRDDGLVGKNFSQDFSKLSPVNFSRDLVDAYLSRPATT